VLEAVGISKSFPGVQALADVTFRVAPGEIVCLVGENGAGKSTLMKILAGVERPDRGTLRLDGRDAAFRTVDEAQRSGVALIHQELNLAETLDVAGNMFLGREPTVGGPLRLISRKIYDDARVIADRLGLDCSPRDTVGSLSLGRRQLVEIGKALAVQTRYLVFDEPTSSLTERETERLFGVIRSLKADGVGVVYITHRMKEILEIADRAVVLRDGRNAGELPRSELSHKALVEKMVGRELKQFFHRGHKTAETAAQPPVVAVHDLKWSPSQRQGVSLLVRPGEVVGLAGLMGAGRTELAETLFGLRRALNGKIQVDGQTRKITTPRDAIAAGVLLVPEDRRRQGLIVAESIRDNISLPSLDRWNRLGLVDRRRTSTTAEELRTKLGIRTPSISQIVGLLSGGNQQKVVLAKWLARSPRLLILDEPTRGVDVGAKAEIYALIDELAANGVGVLMISSDLEEILGVSDRVLVMHQERLAGELTREQLSETAVMHLATGGDATT
jgi:ribose transport system ATP-binding protein